MKPKKKSRLFQLPALPKAPWWLSLTIASVSLMVDCVLHSDKSIYCAMGTASLLSMSASACSAME